jgi:hypothetical protein
VVFRNAKVMRKADLQANQSSSSSRLDGAGNGAPGASCVGNWTYPCLPNGFSDEILDRSGLVDDEVLAGMSDSLLDQPREFIESRKVDDAMVTGQSLSRVWWRESESIRRWM